jgi:hypothetical protein
MFWFKLMFSVGRYCLCLFAFGVEAQDAVYLLASIEIACALFWLWFAITARGDSKL